MMIIAHYYTPLRVIMYYYNVLLHNHLDSLCHYYIIIPSSLRIGNHVIMETLSQPISFHYHCNITLLLHHIMSLSQRGLYDSSELTNEWCIAC